MQSITKLAAHQSYSRFFSVNEMKHHYVRLLKCFTKVKMHFPCIVFKKEKIRHGAKSFSHSLEVFFFKNP